MNFYLLKNIDLLKMGGGVVFAYYHIQTEMVVDMYGGFGFLRSLLKEYDFLFYVLDAKTVDERPPPLKSWLTVGPYWTNVYICYRIGDMIVFD